MDIKNLYKPTFYYEDPQLEVQLRRKGFIKKKAEGLRDQFGLSKASDNVYFMYQLNGKILTFYTDAPKKGGKLNGVLVIPLVKEILTEIKGRPGHIDLILPNNVTVNLKIDDKKERDEWLKGFNFFKEYYKNDKTFDGDGYLGSLDPEFHLAIQSESERIDWDSLLQKTDFYNFFKDKGLLPIIENNIIELIKNRIALSGVTEEIKDKKGSVVQDLGVNNNSKQNNVWNQKRASINLPDSNKIIYIFLISQRPINIVDEEFNIEDDAILDKNSLPPWLEFNKIYYFVHSGSGDVTQNIRFIDVT